MPIVLQVNKMDQAGTQTGSDIAARIGAGDWPVVESVAIRGVGVRETLQQIVQRVAHAI